MTHGDTFVADLTVARQAIDHELAARIARGWNLARRVTPTAVELETLTTEAEEWNQYNADLLRRRYTDSRVSMTYGSIGSPIRSLSSDPVRTRGERVVEAVAERVRHLEALRVDVAKMSEPIASPAPANPVESSPNEGRVVVITSERAIDSEADAEVRSFLLRSTGVAPVSPMRTTGATWSMIRDIERRAHTDAVSIIMMMPDDVGFDARKRGVDPEARCDQDVLFAAGYLAGALAADRVVLLVHPDVVVPPRVGALNTLPFDSRGAWKLELGRWLSEHQVQVDFKTPL